MKRILVDMALMLFLLIGFATIYGCGVAPTAANAVLVGSSVSQIEKNKNNNDNNNSSTKSKYWDPGQKRWVEIK